MNARAAQPAPSDTTYKKVYQTFLLQLKGSPCQRMLQDSSSRSMPALGIELLLRCHICANDWHECYHKFHFSETGGHSADARYTLFQRLHRCTNTILASARNSDLIDNECLSANISIRAPLAWAVTRAVTIVFRFNIFFTRTHTPIILIMLP
jgi:hypothetical protein